KSPALTVLAIVLIAAMLYSLLPLSYLLREQGQNRDNVAGFYAEPENTLDMVYIGASSCITCWEPLKAFHDHGFTSYNFAHHTMTATTVKHYIIEALKTQSPEVFVVDLRPFQYADGINDETGTANLHAEYAIRNGTDHLFYFNKNRNDLIRASVPAGERFSYYFDLFKYHRRWVFLPYQMAEGLRTGDYGFFDFADNVKKNPHKGFYTATRTEKLAFTDYAAVTSKRPLQGETDELFTELLEFCKSEGLKVLFVVHHYPQTKEDKELYNYMEERVRAYGLDFLNANDDWETIGFDFDTDMYDSNHTNVLGAEKYTRYLADYLVTQYDLPDHRTDAAYAEWDALYEAFAEETADAKKELENMMTKDPADN
ncbi:MAG: hypothetical protein IJP92_09720, partial [Lachnospiraceae bacterium]|nr:hypothetical protein [Lachnospiraceae bacterium]